MMPRSLRTGSSFSAEPMITPASRSLWPARYFVAECSTIVHAGRQRANVVGRAQRGVDQRFHPVPAADGHEPLHVDDAELRIGRRFADEQPVLRRDGGFHGLVVAGWHLPRDHAEAATGA